ncbi:unnamed protein product, partial [Ixodes hexagonus]
DGGPICGNTLVEGNETCDCGFSESECNEICCYARRNKLGETGCTLKPNAACSPSAGPCCDKKCKFVDTTVVCSPEGFCTEQGLCEYPFSENRGLHQFTSPADGAGGCKPACEFPSTKSLCNLKLQPGAPCNGLKGYCDVFHKCRDIDEEGPLTRLQRVFFGKESLGAVRDFITRRPLVSGFILIGIIAFLVLMFRCFALHTPTSNPHKRKAHKLKETMRRPINMF